MLSTTIYKHTQRKTFVTTRTEAQHHYLDQARDNPTSFCTRFYLHLVERGVENVKRPWQVDQSQTVFGGKRKDLIINAYEIRVVEGKSESGVCMGHGGTLHQGV
jgi:hypothetical protein